MKNLPALTLGRPSQSSIDRVANAVRNMDDDSPPLIRRLAARLFGKVKTPAAASDAKQIPKRPANEAPATAPPPAPEKDYDLSDWTPAEREELKALDAQLAALPTEGERDAFVVNLHRAITATLVASAPPSKPKARSLPADTMLRADFDKLSPRAAADWIFSHGKIVD